MPLRVAHVVRRFTSVEWGGTETVVRNLVAGERAKGVDARVFATSALADPEGMDREAFGFPVSYFPYRYPYWPMPRADRRALDKKGGNPWSPELFRAVREFNPDVIHLHACGRLACTGIRLAEELGVPSLISLHGGAADVPAAEIAEMLRPLRRKFPYGGVLDRLTRLRFDPLSRASALICISREEERRLKGLYSHPVVRYLPNGVNVPAEPPARPSPRQDGGAFRLLCVSRIDYQKNQIVLLDVLSAIPDCRVTLVGPVTAGWYRDRILAEVEARGLGDRFELIPGLPPDSAELKARFAEADAFVLPSVHEPFGIVALEAWTYGLPLIASAVGGLRDFVKDGENGLLFDPARPETLVSAVKRLQEDAPLRSRLSARGLEDVKGFSWESIVAQTLDLYGELAQ